MLNEESLQFIKEYSDKIENGTEEEIEEYRNKFFQKVKCDKYCHSCNWNNHTEREGYYYNECMLKLIISRR